MNVVEPLQITVSSTTQRTSRPHVLSFLRSRLSQRIVLSVFGSIVAIEILILIPSVYRREQELLRGLAQQSTASLKVAMADVETSREALSSEQLLLKLSQIEIIPMVVGGALYDPSGQRVGTFGEASNRTAGDPAIALINPALRPQFNRRLRRYVTTQDFLLAQQPYQVVTWHDTTSVHRQVHSFIGRIIGLVILISAVVTLTTMIVLRSILIAPILALRNDLLQAAPAALQADNFAAKSFTSHRYCRRDEIGEVIGAFESMFERISNTIAQRQQAEALLRESEARFRTLVNQAAESIIVLDKNATIIDVNQFALNYLAYRREELIGNSLFNINPILGEAGYRAHWQKLESGKPVTLETVHRRKNGQDYPVEVRSSLMSLGGQQRMLSLVRDISDRKLAEQAQARLAEVGELAAMIVHEVRNPFTTVYMALSAFKRMELPPSGQMRLQLAMEESERLKRLLNEILAYSKEQKLVGEPVDLKALSAELVRSLQAHPAAEGRAIQLSDCAERVTVMGDRDKLKQVFINLVTNACEAIPPKETITWNIELESPQQIKIKIHNGGDPIPPDILPKLTKPFVSTKTNGNGLGLAITKRIIEAHGGHLRIQSTIADGTTATVILPRLIESPHDRL